MNQPLHQFSVVTDSADTPSHNIHRLAARWELNDGDSLVIGVLPPPCDRWTLVVNGPAGAVVSTDSAGATLESDGRLVVVVSTQPGRRHNWLRVDAGQGTIELAWEGSSAGYPVPTIDHSGPGALASVLPPEIAESSGSSGSWWRRVLR